MDIFCQDDKLNLSPYYLKPGFAFGGSCLPKDVRALRVPRQGAGPRAAGARSRCCRSNRLQIQHALDQIVETGKKRVGLLGFSFKAGTDDLRESPMVILAEALLGKGYAAAHLRQQRARWRGWSAPTRSTSSSRSRTCRSCSATRSTRSSTTPRSWSIGNAAPEFGEAVTRCRPDQIVLDLVRVPVDRGEGLSRLPGDLLVGGLAGQRSAAHGWHDDAQSAPGPSGGEHGGQDVEVAADVPAVGPGVDDTDCRPRAGSPARLRSGTLALKAASDGNRLSAG